MTHKVFLRRNLLQNQKKNFSKLKLFSETSMEKTCSVYEQLTWKNHFHLQFET